jgi:hypothetical protein
MSRQHVYFDWWRRLGVRDQKWRFDRPTAILVVVYHSIENTSSQFFLNIVPPKMHSFPLNWNSWNGLFAITVFILLNIEIRKMSLTIFLYSSTNDKDTLFDTFTFINDPWPCRSKCAEILNKYIGLYVYTEHEIILRDHHERIPWRERHHTNEYKWIVKTQDDERYMNH